MIKVARLNLNSEIPTRKHPTDAGVDLYAYIQPLDYIEVPPHKFKVLSTGITVEIPEGYAGFIWPKSRNNYIIGGGVVDSGYQGEILVKIINPSDEIYTFYNGDPIAQLVIQPVLTDPVEEVPIEKIHEAKSARGSTGGIVHQQSKLEFGSGWD